jgi:uncharacterized membrane protein YgcG
LVKLYGLENTKAVDKNGKLKSTFLGILQGFLRGGVGGAVAGGIYGGIHSQWDEELKQVAQVSQQNNKVDRALKIESELTRLDANTRQAAEYAHKPRRDAAAVAATARAKDKTEFAALLTKYYPKGLPDRERLPLAIIKKAEEVGFDLDLIPEKAPYSAPAIGSAQNRPTVLTPGQVVSVSDGKGGMVTVPVRNPDGSPVAPMTPYQVEQVKTDNQRNAQFASRGGGRGYSRRSSGRGGGSRGGGGGGLDKFEQGRLDKYENEAAQARARAASLHSRGEDGSAELEAARVADQTASRLKARQGGRGGRGAPSTASPRRGDPLGILN